jgi:hypothetical protein
LRALLRASIRVARIEPADMLVDMSKLATAFEMTYASERYQLAKEIEVANHNGRVSVLMHPAVAPTPLQF